MKTKLLSSPRRGPVAWLLMAWIAMLSLTLAGCQAPPAAPASSNDAVPLDQAVAFTTDSLAAQLKTMPGLLAKMEAKRPVLMDPSLDAATGQQTGLTRLLDGKVNERLRAQPLFEVLPFQQGSLARAQYLVVATIARIAVGKGAYQLHVSLTELKTGMVVAQASARARDDGFDTTPTTYYRDTPVLLIKDKVVEGYIRTAQTAPGQRANNDYMGRVSAAAVINEATDLYNAERYKEALGLYRSVADTPAGEQMRTLNGIYLASWKLGNAVEAEAAFGKLVALGLANKALGVKFLFNPGTTDFWTDPKINGPYALWLRQIARQATAAKVCLEVVGHTSRTGSEAVNDRLSAARAAAVQRKLESESSALAGHMKASGVGYRENLIGTGTDDAVDSLDRRVEFKVSAC